MLTRIALFAAVTALCNPAAARQAEAHDPNSEPPAREPRHIDERPPLLLADTSRAPTVIVSWPTRDGKAIKLEGERGYKSLEQKSRLGHNLDVYVALGGTRLERGLGNPQGATIRCGLYKADNNRPLFHNLADDAAITITIRGIRMNQPAAPVEKTALMHLKYTAGDLARCGIDSTGRNLFVTADAEDPIGATVLPGSGKLGFLDGAEGHGKATAMLEPDGSITITFAFPYHILRHTQDPYQRTNPGGFFEPWHFHVEMEVEKARPPEPEKPESPAPP